MLLQKRARANPPSVEFPSLTEIHHDFVISHEDTFAVIIWASPIRRTF